MPVVRDLFVTVTVTVLYVYMFYMYRCQRVARPTVGRPAARGPALPSEFLCLLLLALPELLESRFALTGFKHAGRTIEGQVARSAL